MGSLVLTWEEIVGIPQSPSGKVSRGAGFVAERASIAVVCVRFLALFFEMVLVFPLPHGLWPRDFHLCCRLKNQDGHWVC